MQQDREEAIEYTLRTVRDNDVRFVRLWFTDILGNLKGFALNVAELENAFDKGMGFDGSSIEDFARIDESDMVAMPDPTTFRILPWRPKQNAVGRMLRHPDPRRHSFRGRSQDGAETQFGAGKQPGVHVLRWA